METIGLQDLWSFEKGARAATVASCDEIRGRPSHHVLNYLELAGKIAELQYRNRDYVLLFRGQSNDFRDDKSRSTLRPTIFRLSNNTSLTEDLPDRFRVLKEAERRLVELYSQSPHVGVDDLQRLRILRWSVLQHYEVCSTPLLDVTHSLRIAASFASDKNESEEAYIYVIGVPNISGSITASAEAGLQIVRLSSACPPSAVRPHIQEGYLLGEYPDLDGMDQKDNYAHWEIDFGRRLVAKFVFNPRSFWTKSGQFQRVGPRALYPSQNDDPLVGIAEKIKETFKETA